jgi:hypothetical protein
MPRGIPNNPGNKQDAAALPIGQLPSIDMPTDKPLSTMARPDLQIDVMAEGPGLGDYAARLAFNEEEVKIIVHESTDKNAEAIVDVYVNGIPQRFIRGMEQNVKRKFVEVLARARHTSLKTEVEIKGDSVVNRIVRNSALRYPFSVREDRNPKGADWLRKILAEA